MSEHIVVVARDLLMRARLEDAARAAGREVDTRSELPDPASPAVMVLVDLDQEDLVADLAAWRQRAPGARVIGFVSHVDEGTRRMAEGLGVEVRPRGASVDAAALLRDL